ncbi:MAG: ankyrin repeat domain-containing protein, partial [Armatimonadetes bacterium]|nr:ankyrin repeat domain-containing protein [Armatimonadota bacterium]
CNWPRAEALAGEGARPALVFGRHPLLFALEREQFRLAHILIERGADPDVADSQGRTPLGWALHWSDSETQLRLLPRAGRLTVTQPASEARKFLYFLIPRVRRLDRRSGTGLSLLVWAAQRSNEPLVRWLLARKVDTNTVDREGRSALCWAVHYRSPGLVQNLLQAGADPNNRAGVALRDIRSGSSRNWEGSHPYPVSEFQRLRAVPLWLAVGNADRESVQLLLDRGASPRATSGLLRAEDLSDMAGGRRDSAMLRLLLDAGFPSPDPDRQRRRSRKRALADSARLRQRNRRNGAPAPPSRPVPVPTSLRRSTGR